MKHRCSLSWLSGACLALSSAASATGGYDISWYSIDGGAGVSAGGRYKVAGTIGQPDAGAMSGGPFRVNGGFWAGAVLDSDGDGVSDGADNCTLVANPDQRDTDADGFGNACDADLDGSCVVNFVDLGIMKSVFFTSDPDADLNGDGSVNFLDLGIMKAAFFAPPGPSGIPNGCD